MNSIYGKHLGLHYNTLGSIYIICGPLLLVKALEKHPFGLANLAFALAALIMLQSRTAMLVFLASNALLLIVLKKKGLLIFALVLFGGVFLFWLPEAIIENFATGLATGTVDALLSGRINLWIPLFSEWIENPVKLIFGAGRYGILTSHLWATSIYIPPLHAHNAYLDFFLDNGIIILGIFMFLFITLLIAGWQTCKQVNTPLCWALFFTLIAYSIGTMTGRQFYPGTENMFLFPCMALLINLMRLNIYGEPGSQTDITSRRIA